MEKVISLIIGYLIGCFQTAYIIGRLKGDLDIRKYGSGNSGTTNAIRVMGWKVGVITFICDFLKAVLGVVLGYYVFGSSIYGLYAGLGVVLGHNYPVFMKFKGGKGIAATLGLLIAYDWKIGLISIGIMAIGIGITKIVSLSSIVMVIAIPILIGLFKQDIEAIILGAVLMVSALYSHRENIKRLLAGNESKIGHKKDIVEN